MRYFFVVLIFLYQRLISPYKGFSCAYRVRHQSESCSNAVKGIVMEHGIIKGMPLIRRRFGQCREAFNDLKAGYVVPHSADLPCDVSCGASPFDCGGAPSIDAGCCDIFDLIDQWRRLSARAKRWLIAGLLLTLLVLSYAFYGRAIGAVYLTDLGLAEQGLKIVKLDSVDVTYKLNLDKALFSFDIDRLEVLDARINVGNELFVVGQVLDAIDDPLKKGSGKRFEYSLKRRWHF